MLQSWWYKNLLFPNSEWDKGISTQEKSDDDDIHHKQGGHSYLNEGHVQNGIQGTLTQRSMECEIARSKTDGSKQVYGLIYTFEIKVEDSEAKGSHLKEKSWSLGQILNVSSSLDSWRRESVPRKDSATPLKWLWFTKLFPKGIKGHLLCLSTCVTDWLLCPHQIYIPTHYPAVWWY